MSFERNTTDFDLRQLIAERAYYIAEQAGFAPERELDFWLQAEVETLTSSSAAASFAAPAKPKHAPRKSAVEAIGTTATAPTVRRRAAKKLAS